MVPSSGEVLPVTTMDTRSTESTPLQTRSPWSVLNGVTSLEVEPVRAPVRGEITIPGSKSYTNRALIIAACAQGSSQISGILRSDDSYWCIEALKALGCRITLSDDVASLTGTSGAWPQPQGTLFIGAAGTIGRFLPGVLAAAPNGEWLVEASERMSERPIAELVNALNALGAKIGYKKHPERFPLLIRAGGLRGGPVSVSGAVSSQFISGVLIASPLAQHPVEIKVTDGIVQHAYVELTLELMRRFGVQVTHDPELTSFSIAPQRYQGREIKLEADASTSSYFFALAAITGGTVRVTNLTAATEQPDFKILEIFERMGCTVTRAAEFTEISGPAGGALRGGFLQSMRELSDMTLTLAAAAPFADSPITITEVAHIRHHECDRISAICASLHALGIAVEERHDGLKIYPGTPRGGVSLSSYDDHRVAMSLALIGTRTAGVKIQDPGCVSKTCPDFFQRIERMGVRVRYERR